MTRASARLSTLTTTNLPRISDDAMRAIPSSGPANEEDHIRVHRRIAERRVHHGARGGGQARDAGNLLHLDVADARHERESLLELLGSLGREGNRVRMAADRAVVVVARHGVESPSRRGQ